MKVSLGLAVLLVTASASAQDESRATGGTPNLELKYASYEPMGEQYRLRAEYEAIGLGAPVAGIVLSSIAMFAGPILMVAGSFENFCLCDDPEPLSARGSAMIGVGTIMTFGGLAGLIASSVVLAKKRKRRRWLASQLDSR